MLNPHLLQPFSLPVPGVDEALFHAIIASSGVATMQTFLDHYHLAIKRESQGLLAVLAAWCEPGPTAERSATAWSLAFGMAGLAMKDVRGNIPETATRLGLRIAETWIPSRWESRNRVAPMIFDRFFVERAVGAQATPGEDIGMVSIVTDEGERHVFRRQDGRWHCDTLAPMRSVAPHGRAILLPNGALPIGGAADFFRECHSVETVDDDALSTFRNGYALLEAAARDYLQWVDRVLNGIVVGALQPQFRTVTGSWEEVPGYIHSSYPHGAVEVAELLVHECAHQYYYMLERLGPMDDGSDTRLYWSPPIRKERPLSRVLMAYHALANTLILFDRVLDAGLDTDGYVAANRDGLREDVETLARPLRGNPALTSIGVALFAPLDERTAALAA